MCPLVRLVGCDLRGCVYGGKEVWLKGVTAVRGALPVPQAADGAAMACNATFTTYPLSRGELGAMREWTRGSVRDVLNRALDKHDAEQQSFRTLIQMWIDGVHSRPIHLIKACCGVNRLIDMGIGHCGDYFQEITAGPADNPLPQPDFVPLLFQQMEAAAHRTQGTYCDGVFSLDELRRRALVDYVWVFVG